MSCNEEQIDSKDKEIEAIEKFIETERENQNDKLITLDLATFDKIPQQLYKLINGVSKCKNYTKFDILNALVLYCAYETTFVGDWLEIDFSKYTLSWSSGFNMRLLQHCTFPNNYCINASPLTLKFKFSLEQSRKIIVNSLESGCIAIISAYELKEFDKTHCIQARSLAIPISRYIPFKELCENIPNSFRNLRELSILLKENLFIPIRNQIYEDCAVLSTPWLNGLPECVLVKILKYLNKKDIHSLKLTCHKQYDFCKAYASNKKRKYE